MLIYHYTSLKAFHDMVKNVMESKDDEKSFEFWASSSFCMNDIVEFTHGYEILKELLPSFEDGVEERFRLSLLEKQAVILGKSPDYVSKQIKDNAVIMDMIPYVISFSYMPDYLPMWYMYADRGEGVCMGFEIEELKNIWPVIYDFDKIEDDYKNMIIGIIEDVYSKYLDRVKAIGDDFNLIWEEKMSTIRVICTALSPYFKHPSFEFEHEYRLIQYGCEEKVDIRQTEKGTIVLFAKIKLPFQSLKKVIVGPCAVKNCYVAIHTELKCCNPQHLIEIESSLIPYRIL